MNYTPNEQTAIDKMKKYFNRYLTIAKRYKKAKNLLAEYQEQSIIKAYDPARIHTAPGKVTAPTESRAVNIVDMERKAVNLMVKHYNMLIDIIEHVNMLEDPEEMELLTLRILDGRTWTECAALTNKTTRHLRNIYDNALLNIAIKIIDSNKQKAEKQQRGDNPPG